MRTVYFLIFAFVYFLFAANSFPVAQNEKYSISGIVYDEENKTAVQFASVVIPAEKKKATTGEKGEFTILLQKPGEYQIIIHAPDLEPEQAVVTVTDLDPRPVLTFYLKLRKLKGQALDIHGKEIFKIWRDTR